MRCLHHPRVAATDTSRPGTSYVNGKAFPAIIVANAPSGSVFDEAAYTTAAGLFEQGVGTLSSAGDQPVPNAHSDHQPVVAPTAY
jgi:hypothetical protein